MLSISRIVLLPFVVLIINKNEYNNLLIFIFLIFFVATDFFDGFLARKLNQITKLGKILDPVADKICIIVIIYLITKYKGFPNWAFITILIREIFILSGSLILIKKKNIIPGSNILGKAGTLFISISLLGYLFLNKTNLLAYTLLIIGLTFYILAFLLYIFNYLHFMSHFKLKDFIQKILAKF